MIHKHELNVTSGLNRRSFLKTASWQEARAILATDPDPLNPLAEAFDSVTETRRFSPARKTAKIAPDLTGRRETQGKAADTSRIYALEVCP